MISRRDFLKAAGITLLAAHIPGFIPETVIPPNFEPVYGRLLKGVNGLWTDSVIPISATLPDGYQTPHGLLPKSRLQPMLSPASYQQTAYEPPFVAEVVGASAVLRRSCSYDLPQHRVGHGGLLNVVDQINCDGVYWYGAQLGDNPRLFWTHSAPFAPMTLTAPLRNLTLKLNRDQYILTAFHADQPLFNVPYTASNTLEAGEYLLTHQTPIKKFHVYSHYFAPFVTTFGEQLHLYGAYWHNVFGETGLGEGIEVPPYVAKWIYGASANCARVMIV